MTEVSLPSIERLAQGHVAESVKHWILKPEYVSLVEPEGIGDLGEDLHRIDELMKVRCNITRNGDLNLR